MAFVVTEIVLNVNLLTVLMFVRSIAFMKGLISLSSILMNVSTALYVNRNVRRMPFLLKTKCQKTNKFLSS